MTRKHYVAIAAMLKDTQAAGDVETVRKVIAERLCALLQQDNARFDRERFLAACGVQS